MGLALFSLSWKQDMVAELEPEMGRQTLDVNTNAPHRQLRRVLYSHPNMRSARASRIVDIALHPNKERAEIARPVIEHLVSEILKLPMEADVDSLSLIQVCQLKTGKPSTAKNCDRAMLMIRLNRLSVRPLSYDSPAPVAFSLPER